MNQFVQRLVNYLANEVIIKGLANSRTFQRFAVRTDKSLQELHKTGQETFNKTFDEWNKQQVRMASSGTTGPPKPLLTGFPGFIKAFVAEVRKDLGMSK